MLTGKGFSLIELMVAVAIVGILAAVGYPSYTEYITRGKISEATTGLQEARVKMEQYFLDNRTYLNGAACGATLPTSKYFTFTCAATAATYTVTAAGVAGQGMTGFQYTVTQANVRGSTTPFGDNATCWVLKKGGVC